MRAAALRNGIVAGIVVSFAALTFVSETHAQPGPRGFDGFGGGLRGMLPGLRDLDLTDAQRDTIRDIAERNRDAGSALAEQIGAARAALNEAVMVEVVNESAIRARAAEVASLEADAAVHRAYLSSEILRVLTPDQKAALRELQAEARERRGERLGRRGQRR